MIPLTLAEVAEVTGGSVHGDAEVRVTAPATVDSRQVEAGGLFVAIAGERVDGHDFAARAVEDGAAAVLASRPLPVPTVVVDDVVEALGRLARHVLEHCAVEHVVALTGSQGKTGTKDYLAQVLAEAGPTVATSGNFNNEIGVPLTVLRATPETRHLVVEMGARGLGHIAYLCRIAPPTVAAVLNVGTAHMSEFGSREAIAQAKGEIVEALSADGVAVLNADDALVSAMADRTQARVLTFGRADGDAAGEGVTWGEVSFDDLDRPTATFSHDGRSATCTLLQPGAHQLANAAAATALALGVGLDLADVVDALGRARSLSRWRMELTERADGVVVVNDSYNANPASMAAALAAAGAIGERRSARTVAVLGPMAELGATADEAHREVGREAARRQVDVLLVVGDARELAQGAAEITSWRGTAVCVPDRDAALAWLRENIAPRDVVLVKASRAAALEVVAEGLLELEENTE